MAVDLCSYLEALATRRWGGLLEAWGWGFKWGMSQDVSGWWLTYPSEKYEFVSWDDDIPNEWNTIKMFQTTNQVFLAPAGAKCPFLIGEKSFSRHRMFSAKPLVPARTHFIQHRQEFYLIVSLIPYKSIWRTVL